MVGKPAEGIILESPFFNIVEEVELHPFTWAFYFNKIMLRLIEKSLLKLELQFRSDIQYEFTFFTRKLNRTEKLFIYAIYQFN